MRSRFATLAILGLLAWLLYDFAQQEDLRTAPPPSGGLLFPGFEPASVTFLSMGFRTGHVVDIERDPGGPWRITYPVEAREPAQAEFVEKVLNDLAYATMIPVEDQGTQVDPASVGLADTNYSITFGIGGQRTTLEIGDRDALGNLIYVRRDGLDEIVLSTPNLKNAVEQFRAEDYVDKHLLRGLRGAVNRLRVERPSGVVLDARLAPGGSWTMSEPAPWAVDASRVSTLARNLQSIQQVLVAAVAPDDDILAQLGLPNAEQVSRGDWAESTVLELYAEGEPPARVFLQRGWEEMEDGMYAIREDLYKLLEVDRNEFNLLTNDTSFFRQRRLMPPVRERAHTFIIEVGGERLLDIRRGPSGDWRFEAPERLAGERVDTQRVEGRSSLSVFLSRLDGLEVVDFVDEPQGTGEAALRVGVSVAGAERTLRVDLFDLDGERVIGKVSDRPGEGLVIDPEVRDLLSPFVADELRDLGPLSVDRAEWAKLEIELDGLDAPLTVSRAEDGSWVGDDTWGRRFGVGRDLVIGFRGYVWRPRREDADFPARVSFLDGDGAVLARVRFRPPLPGEQAEALGVPIVVAVVDGVDRAQLLVPDFWLANLLALTSDPVREPLPLNGGG